MTYIWDRDALWSLSKHPSADIQEWAVSRLLAWHPDSEETLLPELEAALDHTRTRLAAVVTGARARLSLPRREAEPEMAFLLACTLATWRAASCRRLLRQAQTAAALCQGIVLRPWQAEIGPDLSARLSSADATHLLTALEVTLDHDDAHLAYRLASGLLERSPLQRCILAIGGYAGLDVCCVNPVPIY